MAKAPSVKFPRIQAGFYYVTLEGQVVGYISKKVDGKETSWQIYQTTETDLTQDNLLISTMIEETELFREAKDFSKEHFINSTPVTEVAEEETISDEVVTEVTSTVELQEPEWNESEVLVVEEDDFFDEVNLSEELEEELALV